MKTLTDLEICKEIAEIDNVLVDEFAGGLLYSHKPNELTWYNPLNDDALCFQLMVKYTVYLEYCLPEIGYFASIDGEHGTENQKSPNRAVLLAIIEAHDNG